VGSTPRGLVSLQVEDIWTQTHRGDTWRQRQGLEQHSHKPKRRGETLVLSLLSTHHLAQTQAEPQEMSSNTVATALAFWPKTAKTMHQDPENTRKVRKGEDQRT
jgi:hypothetical protein